MEWIDIEAELPPPGDKCLFYRPLAANSGDEIVAVKVAKSTNQFCWKSTVPQGKDPVNYSSGSCHTTHWMPLPAPPKPTTGK